MGLGYRKLTNWNPLWTKQAVSENMGCMSGSRKLSGTARIFNLSSVTNAIALGPNNPDYEVSIAN